MKRVYVAGAMSSDNIVGVLNNLHDGIEAGARLLELGFAPFVPHFDSFFQVTRGRKYAVDMNTYKEFCLKWLQVSDAVLVLPGSDESKGVQAELDHARLCGIPVFEDLETLVLWNVEN